MKAAHEPLRGDQPNYDSIALNLITGHGYKLHYEVNRQFPTALRGPSYVLFLATTYLIVGHHVVAPMILQILMDLLTCYLLFQIGLMLFKRRDAALLGALLYAIYPPIIRNTAAILNETFTCLMFVLAIYEFLRYMENGKRSQIYWSAAAIGIGALSKPIFALLPVLFAISALPYRDKKRCLIDLGMQLLIVALMFSPWVIRNALTFKAFIPTVTNGGFTFWGGVGPANGRVVDGLDQSHVPAYVLPAIRGMSEHEADRWFYRDAFKIIKSNPGRYATLLPVKFTRLWFSLPYDEPPTKGNILFLIFNLGLMALALLSVFTLRPPKWASLLLLFLFLYFSLLHTLFFATFRYAMPIYAFMFPFSAAGALGILRPVKKICPNSERLHVSAEREDYTL